MVVLEGGAVSCERGTPVRSGGWGAGKMQDLLQLQKGVTYRQPTGPDLLYYRDDSADRPRAMGI